MANANRYGSWRSVRSYAREGFTRGRSRLDEAAQQERRMNGFGEDIERRE